MWSRNVCYIVIALLFSCTAKTPSQPEVQTDSVIQTVAAEASAQRRLESFEKGKVISSVTLLADPSQSYALYLPSSYSDSVPHPVIFFFDPHGEGINPLKLYRGLAERNGFILAGSNNSKNGLELPVSNGIANSMINDVSGRLNLDKTRIALCGFSGGAKVALSSGGVRADVSYIFYCGAVIAFSPSHPLTLLGFAGKKDMNYTDLILFDNDLQKMPVKHYLVEWNGPHEFPVEKVFADAFELMKTGAVPGYDKKKVTITEAKVEEEQHYKQDLINAYQAKDLNWWMQEIRTLNIKKRNDPMYERLLGFISLSCYSLCSSALRQNDLAFASHILAIYQAADPMNEAVGEFAKEIESRKHHK